MFFSEPQCVEVGSVHLGTEAAVEKVLVEPTSGTLWLINRDRNTVAVLDSASVETAMSRQAALADQRVTETQSVFTLSSFKDALKPPLPDSDHIRTVLFASPSPKHLRGDVHHERVALIVTHCGALIARSLTEPAMPYTHCRLPIDGIHHSLVLPSTVGTGEVNVLLSTKNDTGCEIVAVELHSLIGDKNGALVAPPSVRGLFRVVGDIACLLFDSAEMAVLCITRAGAVDVWSWKEERDTTSRYVPMTYDAQKFGPPAAEAVRLVGAHLWVGTEQGCLLRLPFRRASPGETDGSAAPALVRTTAHGGAIRTLMVMSMGTRVWSCGNDGKICVWDAASGELTGSFLFAPDGDENHVTPCEPLIVTSLWGAHAPSGTLTSFNVTESLVLGEEAVLTTVTEQRASVQNAHESKAMRTLLEYLLLLTTGTHSQAVTDALDENGLQTPATALNAAGKLEDAFDGPLGAILELVTDAAACRIVMTRYLESRPNHFQGLTPTDTVRKALRPAMQLLLKEVDRLRQLEDDVRHFLRQVSAAVSPTLPLESLEDARAALEECVQSQAAPAALSASLETDTEPGMMTAPPSEEDVRKLQEALAQERALRVLREKSIAELAEENSELSRRVSLLKKQAERGDEENDVLRRSLLASRKAADAQSSEAAKLYGLEARLRESEERNSVLEQDVARLARIEQEASKNAEKVRELHSAVERYEQKEALAQRVIADFLHTQHEIDRELQRLGEYATDVAERAKRDPPTTSLVGSFEDLLRHTFDAEDAIDEILHQQKTYITDLKKEFLS